MGGFTPTDALPHFLLDVVFVCVSLEGVACLLFCIFLVLVLVLVLDP